jgi:hypothetical protein
MRIDVWPYLNVISPYKLYRYQDLTAKSNLINAKTHQRQAQKRRLRGKSTIFSKRKISIQFHLLIGIAIY